MMETIGIILIVQDQNRDFIERYKYYENYKDINNFNLYIFNNHIEFLKNIESIKNKYFFIITTKIYPYLRYIIKSQYENNLLKKINETESNGLVFRTQSLKFGYIYNVIFINNDIFKKYSSVYKKDENHFIEATKKNIKMNFIDDYFGYNDDYSDMEIQEIFKKSIFNLTQNKLNNQLEYFHLAYVFKKYKISSSKEFHNVYSKMKNSVIYNNDYMEYNLNKIISYTNSVKNYNTEIYFNDINDIPSYHAKVFESIFNILNIPCLPDTKLQNIKNNKNYDVGLVYWHYMENTNFERHISNFYKLFKKNNINCCVLILNNNVAPVINLSCHFDYEDTYFLDVDQTCKFILQKKIKKLSFMDGILNTMTKFLNENLDSIDVYIISAGFITYMTKYIKVNERDHIKNIKKIICNNSQYPKYINKFYPKIPVKYQKIFSLRNDIVINDSIDLKKKLTKTISFVGRFSEEKMPLMILDSFVLINNIYTEYKFNFIGTGSEIDKMRKRLEGSRGNINIIQDWHSFNSIKQYIKEADYIILSSISEGLPQIILEAFSMGTPIICPNIPGISDIVKDNYNGFIFDLAGLEVIDEDLFYNYKRILDSVNQVDIYMKNVNALFKKLIFIINNIQLDKYTELQKNCFETLNNLKKENIDIKEIFDF